jgi:hypothetical protein
MESLLNAEVIKAAASSPLGVLSLMLLILGVLALAFFQKESVKAKLIIFATLTTGALFFGYLSLSSKLPDPHPTPEASPAFMVGRWQVEQKIGGLEGGTYVDYFKNGSFSGREEVFANGQGKRVETNGNWKLEETSTNTFLLTLMMSNRPIWSGNFRILDENRVHNIDENYDAVRVPH